MRDFSMVETEEGYTMFDKYRELATEYDNE